MKYIKKIDSAATHTTLKNKICNLRTCYRRELKKIAQSEKSGAGADDVYVPSLWYFELLSFLKDDEMPRFGTSSMDFDVDTEIDEIEVNNTFK